MYQMRLCNLHSHDVGCYISLQQFKEGLPPLLVSKNMSVKLWDK